MASLPITITVTAAGPTVVFGTFDQWLPENHGIQSPFWYQNQINATADNNVGPSGPVTQFTASISGTVMTVTAMIAGTIKVGEQVVSGGTQLGAAVSSFGTGTGSTGTYNLDTNLGTVASTTMGLNEFIATGTIPNGATFPNGLAMHSQFSTTGGNVIGALVAVFANQEGQQANVGVPYRTQSFVPQSNKMANFTSYTVGYDMTCNPSGPGAGYDVIVDYFNDNEQDPQGSAVFSVCRLYEVDFSAFGPVSGFGALGYRLFTLTGCGAPWDGNWCNFSNFSGQWRFFTARPGGLALEDSHQAASGLSLLAMHRQLMWNGVTTGREYTHGHSLILEPIAANTVDVQLAAVNGYTGTMVSNPDIMIAANASANRLYPSGNHFRGAGAGQNSIAVYPEVFANYQIRRVGDRLLVRHGADMTTLDFVSTRNNAASNDAVDKVQFSDRTVTIATMPMVTDLCVALYPLFVANTILATMQASPAATGWAIRNGDPGAHFQINSTGQLSLTAAGVAALAGTATVVGPTGLSGPFPWGVAATTGTVFRVSFQNSLFNGPTRNTLALPQNAGVIAARKISITIGTDASSAAGTLQSAWIGYDASSGQFQPGTAVQLKFGGLASIPLAAGAHTYTSDAVAFDFDGASSLLVGYHVTGTGVQMLDGSFGSGADAGTTWGNVTDPGAGGFTPTNGSGGEIVGVLRIDTAVQQFIDLEVEATNAAGKSIGLVTLGPPIFGSGFEGAGSVSPNITLAAGGANGYQSMTATATTASANGDIATTSVNSDAFRLHYCELTINHLDGAGSVALGFINDHGLGALANAALGGDTNSVGAYADASGGIIKGNNTTLGSMGVNAGNGAVIRMALALDDWDTPTNATPNSSSPPSGAGHLVWFAVNNGNWNNNPAANPALMTGGININAIAQFTNSAFGGPLIHPAAFVKKTSATGAKVTINLGDSPWAFLCPPGFMGWRTY